MRPLTSPGRIAKARLSTATSPPNRFVRPRVSSNHPFSDTLPLSSPLLWLRRIMRHDAWRLLCTTPSGAHAMHSVLRHQCALCYVKERHKERGKVKGTGHSRLAPDGTYSRTCHRSTTGLHPSGCLVDALAGPWVRQRGSPSLLQNEGFLR